PWAGRCWSTLHDIKSHKHHPPDSDGSNHPPGQPRGLEDEVWFHELDEPDVYDGVATGWDVGPPPDWAVDDAA
ncbi:hypothetical protein, partial [Nesterenkonia sedimenti]|uniref:hypothetical protein n=1 Tax=Nesterenkonia sedimenti TaxID=1463632 RepID=UPI001B3B27E5